MQDIPSVVVHNDDYGRRLSEIMGSDPVHFMPGSYPNTDPANRIMCSPEITRNNHILLALRGGDGITFDQYFQWLLLSTSALLDPNYFGARKVTVLTPRLPGDREDKEWAKTRDEVSSKRDRYHSQHYSYVPRLLSATGVNELLTFNAHPDNLRAGGYEQYGDMKLTSISAVYALADHVKSRLPKGDFVVLSPDKEGNSGRILAEAFSRRLGLECRAVNKTKDEHGDVKCQERVDLKGRRAIGFDDTTSTMSSLLELGKSVENCRGIIYAVIHPNLASHGRERLVSNLEHGVNQVPVLGVVFGNTLGLNLPDIPITRERVSFVETEPLIYRHFLDSSD